MGKRTEHKPGTFSWVDLATTDPAAAKTFYGELFGWTAEDVPMSETEFYTMLRLDGDFVAALYQLDDERRQMGIPPHWLSYITVADVDATAARAQELGSKCLFGPFDVFDAGRQAIIEDPTGAVFAAWQPRDHIGAGRVNDPGSLTWNELRTRDPETAAAFYSGLFGWEVERIEENGKLAYLTIKNDGRANGGMMPMTEQHGDAPPSWLPYFTVSSTDDAMARVRELGGDVLAGPIDLPNGRIAVVRDPQGAAFALFAGVVDD